MICINIHSIPLRDRIVKFISENRKSQTCLILLVHACGKRTKGKVITRKPILLGKKKVVEEKLSIQKCEASYFERKKWKLRDGR